MVEDFYWKLKEKLWPSSLLLNPWKIKIPSKWSPKYLLKVLQASVIMSLSTLKYFKYWKGNFPTIFPFSDNTFFWSTIFHCHLEKENFSTIFRNLEAIRPQKYKKNPQKNTRATKKKQYRKDNGEDPCQR